MSFQTTYAQKCPNKRVMGWRAYKSAIVTVRLVFYP
jgi:hypothetical protein